MMSITQLLRFSLGLKFALISLAYTIPIGILLGFLIMEKNEEIRLTKSEESGTKLIAPLVQIEFNLMQAKIFASLLAFYPASDGSTQSKIDESGQNIATAFASLEKSFESLGSTFGLNESYLSQQKLENLSPSKLRKEWLDIPRSYVTGISITPNSTST